MVLELGGVARPAVRPMTPLRILQGAPGVVGAVPFVPKMISRTKAAERIATLQPKQEERKSARPRKHPTGAGRGRTFRVTGFPW